MNISFVLKTPFTDQVGSRHHPSMFNHLYVVLEKVALVCDIVQYINCLEFTK